MFEAICQWWTALEASLQIRYEKLWYMKSNGLTEERLGLRQNMETRSHRTSAFRLWAGGIAHDMGSVSFLGGHVPWQVW